MNKFRSWAAALALATMAGAAPAALVLQSNNLEVLDTDTQLLWLYSWRDDADPLKTWAEGNAWAAALTVGGAAAGAWRMPTFGELADLWADPAVGESNTGLDNNFINVQGTSLYWSGTPNSQNANLALAFSPQTGGDVDFNKNSTLYTVAVRSAGAGPGPSTVPEPQSAALALLGLGALALQGRRRRPAAAVVAAAALVTMASAAQAVPMVYTYQVNASGQLNGQTFTNSAVSVTLTGESAVSYQPCGYCYLVLADTTRIEVAGVGSDSFANPITAVSNFVDGYLGFGEPISDYGILFIASPSAVGYLLQTPLGPVSGLTDGNPGIAFATLAGSLTFNSFDSDGTFLAVASAVPEPGTWLLMLGGVAALVQRRMAVMKRFMAAA